MDKLMAKGQKTYRQKANPSPEAQQRLEAIITKMRSRAIAERKRIDKERYQAEIFFTNRWWGRVKHG